MVGIRKSDFTRGFLFVRSNSDFSRRRAKTAKDDRNGATPTALGDTGNLLRAAELREAVEVQGWQVGISDSAWYVVDEAGPLSRQS
jgi:hypothetical protein